MQNRQKICWRRGRAGGMLISLDLQAEVLCMYDMQPYLKTIDDVIAAGRYKANWDSLSAYRVPEWYDKAKFGIFIHWGAYSVPAFGSEWYPRNMYMQGSREYEHHLAHYGKHTAFGYKDFIPLFKAERFNADEWARLFKQAGARYVIPVAEHHDGFQMYKSKVSHWNAFEMGPKRDVLGELKTAVEQAGMELGASSHRIEHWFFMGHGKEFESDLHEPLQRGDLYWPSMPEPHHHDLFSTPAPSEEYMQDWLVRTAEIIDRYRPKVLYFDWWIQHSALKPYLQKLAAYYYNRADMWGSGGVICYKHDAFLFGTAVPDVERGQFATLKPYKWQTDTTVAKNSWCYTDGNVYKDPKGLLQDLIDIVSKNGNLILNVGPKADGTIPEEDAAILRTIGDWLCVNGEAIYESRTWRTFGEGPTEVLEGQFSDRFEKHFTSEDFRFTTAHGALYAIALEPAADGDYCIKTLGVHDFSEQAAFGGIIDSVRVLGDERPVRFSRDSEGLHLHTDVRSAMPVAFKITLR